MNVPWWWLALLALLATLSVTKAGSGGQGPAGPALFRQKREWLWNRLSVEEEKDDHPFKIGTLRSTRKNERTRFEISGEGVNEHIFTVNEYGDLYANVKLDREEKSLYHLRAKLLDENNKMVEPEEDFDVVVTDVNDNDPVFSKSYNASIRERSLRGTQVIKVTATDADDPTTSNGELRYTLLQGGDIFDINGKTGVITSKYESLDREVRRLYMLVVQAQDQRGMKQGGTATTSVTVTLTDINDNMASFTKSSYLFKVPETQKMEVKIGTLELEDRDELQNKDPIFTISAPNNIKFNIQHSQSKDGNLMLKQALDYETQSSYTFSVDVRETSLQNPADNKDKALTRAQVTVQVLDIDEPPIFSKDIYMFSVEEEVKVTNIGVVTARDPDHANRTIRYSIEEKDCPVAINPITGQLYTHKMLDRELKATHLIQVKAEEEPHGLASFVKVNLRVIDINDNEPELSAEDIFVCENDMKNTIIGTIRATDKDEQLATFSFSLVTPNSNFSVIDNNDNTADILLIQGSFRLDDPQDYILEIGITDGGRPLKSSITPLPIKVCRCDSKRNHFQCKAAHLKSEVNIHALIAILLCILTILVIVILIVLRKRYQKEALVGMGGKNTEIHEQLVSYDEEGGGEMDTNGYDVSVLTSARHDGSMMMRQGPSLYAMVQPRPPACKGDMAVMIEVKKDEADRDREGIPYDTLHIYGYEGPESLAGSLSSLDSSSTGSNLDYDFLQDWGPRFRTLAQLYGVDEPDTYSPY